MGQLMPRPPLPPTATPAERRADLARIRREIRRDAHLLVTIYAGALVAGLAVISTR